MIQVLVVDDDRLVREAIKLLLKEANNIRIVGEASTAFEALKQVREKKPNIVLLDIHLPDISGIHIAQKIRRSYSDTKVIILTLATHDLFATRSLAAGVQGYLVKSADQDELLNAIQVVQKGGHYISPTIASQLTLARVGQREKSLFSVLSDQEMEVMLMIVRGMEVPEISEKLFLSSKTINSYRYRIFQKLQVESDVMLTLLAIQEGIVEVES